MNIFPEVKILSPRDYTEQCVKEVTIAIQKAVPAIKNLEITKERTNQARKHAHQTLGVYFDTETIYVKYGKSEPIKEFFIIYHEFIHHIAHKLKIYQLDKLIDYLRPLLPV